MIITQIMQVGTINRTLKMKKSALHTPVVSEIASVIVFNTVRDLLGYLMLLFSTKTNNNFLFKNIKEEEKTLSKYPLYVLTN